MSASGSTAVTFTAPLDAPTPYDDVSAALGAAEPLLESLGLQYEIDDVDGEEVTVLFFASDPATLSDDVQHALRESADKLSAYELRFRLGR